MLQLVERDWVLLASRRQALRDRLEIVGEAVVVHAPFYERARRFLTGEYLLFTTGESPLS